jgi:Flp pilus assembly CpaF family ATPase
MPVHGEASLTAEPKSVDRRPAAASGPPVESGLEGRHSEAFHEVKTSIFSALIEAIDLSQMAKLDADSAREEIRDIVNEIIAIKNIVMSISEQEELLDDICNDVLGYGPLEPVLSRDDISDVMVNGAATIFVEISGKIQRTGIRFRDNQQLLNICQRIVGQIGRRVDESSPICDARLPDGSRVDVIAPPLAIDGPALTIRKFKKDKLTLEQRLLQAMNTGHDGSMGTLHANSPREALQRIESMITMGGYALPSRTIREMVCASVDVVIQAARLRDGSRRITHITEVLGLEGDVIITQDLFLYDIVGEDANCKLIGRHRSTGIGRPRFWERARYYNEEKRFAAALDAALADAPKD